MGHERKGHLVSAAQQVADHLAVLNDAEVDGPLAQPQGEPLGARAVQLHGQKPGQDWLKGFHKATVIAKIRTGHIVVLQDVGIQASPPFSVA